MTRSVELRKGGSVLHLVARCSVLEDCAPKELAWADVRRPPNDSQPHIGLEGLRVRAEATCENVLQLFLTRAAQKGFPEAFQVRISHRPESPSRLRLAKGLFSASASKPAAHTEEMRLHDGRAVLVGAWRLTGDDFAHCSDGCRDQSICCFVLSKTHLPHSELISAVKDCVVVNGVCAINYPDIAVSMSAMGNVVGKFHPGNREDVVLVSNKTTAAEMVSWLDAARTN